jgi:hypothetical protein
VCAVGTALYFNGLRHDPPGFFLDESSIAFNAHTISQTGRDEYGIAWPLYFRAFGEFKNPIYIYLLAALFRLTGPSILVARLFSATAGLATAAVLGLLATRVTRRSAVGLFVTVAALLTPWLFELSRVVLEVSLYPLALAVFLFGLHSAALKLRWSWRETVPLAAMLALLTYTYSIGRLLAPLLTIGLLFFIRRVGLRSVLSLWALYALTLVPLAVFSLRNPRALTARFSLITYLTPQHGITAAVLAFLRHYVVNLNPWRLLVTGDPNYYQMAHLEGAELMLVATVVLSAAGAWLVLRGRKSGAWWTFILYGLAVSIVPGSLTQEPFHMLHLVPVPVFLLVLSVPAVDWLLSGSKRRRTVLLGILALTLGQGAIFQWRYAASADSTRRLHLFDAGYPQIVLPAALTNGGRPVYLSDAYGIAGYIQAYWYATLRDLPLSTFVHLPIEQSPPAGALVITTKDICVSCTILAECPPYTVYLASPPRRVRAPLPENAFHAEISVLDPPPVLRAGAQATIRVRVKNVSDATWFGRKWTAESLQVALGNHWLDQNGKTLINDDGRSPLLKDLRPGEESELSLIVNTPHTPGEYVLEIDMVQEGVSWFGLRGSRTQRIRITVED